MKDDGFISEIKKAWKLAIVIGTLLAGVAIAAREAILSPSSSAQVSDLRTEIAVISTKVSRIESDVSEIKRDVREMQRDKP